MYIYIYMYTYIRRSLMSISTKLIMLDFCSETAQGRDSRERSYSVGGEEVRSEVSERGLEAASGPDLVESLETAEGTEEKRE